jgi:hypothetical protein
VFFFERIFGDLLVTFWTWDILRLRRRLRIDDRRRAHLKRVEPVSLSRRPDQPVAECRSGFHRRLSGKDSLVNAIGWPIHDDSPRRHSMNCAFLVS